MFESFTGLPVPAKFLVAFIVVLALIGVTAWIVRRFGASGLGGGARGSRQPRLAVIDAASVDGRRRLVLIRRDNIEHLLMIGGPSDVVVESNIVRAAGAAPREAGRIDTPAPRETTRAAQPADTGWPLQPLNEPPAPAPVAPPATRSFRAAATEEPWTPPEPGARPRPAENLSGLAAELSSRLAAPELPPQPVVPRHESTAPRLAVTPVPPEPPEMVAGSDQNLADMAHQLEAALRRTAAPEARPPVTDPLAAQGRPTDVRVSGPEGWPRSEPKPEAKAKADSRLDVRPEPMFEIKPEPQADTPRHEPRLDIKPEPKPQTGLKSQDFYDNLEEEMASLLGRPSGKS